MSKSDFQNEPLISVIIPCYNHGRYLAGAINSVFAQEHYSNYEIIVVDDGSVDDTKAVAGSFANVRYIYQQNAGLSAARNTGIKTATGIFLIFLDADDWLLPGAMQINASYLINNDQLAFVSGGHIYLNENDGQRLEIRREVSSDHYCEFLQRNYIAMHATVLYQRWAFEHLRYDTTLRACEDYDIFLRISREHPVMHHTDLIAVYRIHHTNMSANILMMIDSALLVLKRQEPFLRNDAEWSCYKKGISEWKEYYGEELYERLLAQHRKGEMNLIELNALEKLHKALYQKLIKLRSRERFRGILKKMLPGFIVKLFSKSYRAKKKSPA